MYGSQCPEVSDLLLLVILKKILMKNCDRIVLCLEVCVVLLSLTLLTNILKLINLPQEKAVSYNLCCVAANLSHIFPKTTNLSQVDASCPYDRKKFTEIEVLEHKGGPTVDIISLQTLDLKQERAHLMRINTELTQRFQELRRMDELLRRETEEFNRKKEEMVRNKLEISLEKEETRLLKCMSDDLRNKKTQLLRLFEEFDLLKNRIVQLAVQLEDV